jgi:predicted metal-dependent enzyme (double-stranded beta helix superfamily)
MKSSRYMLLLAFLIASTLIAQDAQVTPLMSKDLADFPGKEGLMITVVYPPGASDPIHRHNAHAFVYVLEGSVVMQVKFIPLAGTQAPRNQRSSSWSCLRTRARRCCYQ